MTKHRPVSDRIAETQAQLNALIAKANKATINESPEIQAIDDEIRIITNSMLKYNRWASEGEEKIQNFEHRVNEWRQRLQLAQQKRSEATMAIEGLRSKRKALAESMAKDIVTEA